MRRDAMHYRGAGRPYSVVPMEARWKVPRPVQLPRCQFHHPTLSPNVPVLTRAPATEQSQPVLSSPTCLHPMRHLSRRAAARVTLPVLFHKAFWLPAVGKGEGGGWVLVITYVDGVVGAGSGQLVPSTVQYKA